ncbi:hypothetical protein QTP88_028072 [Uroleucon formosanum]
MVWTGVHRGFVVRAYYENNHSVIATQRDFRIHFGIPRTESIPSANTIKFWIRQLEETGSTLSGLGHGAPRTVRTPENVQLVRESIEQSPRRSARKHAVALGISDRSLRRILHEDLSFHSYKLMLVQELHATDYDNRKNLCQQILLRIPPTSTFFCSDEAHFHLSGTVNKQNFRYWAANNPRQLHERPLHSPKVTVCCSVSQFGVIGPYFFEDENRTVTVTSARYVVMLVTYLQHRLEEMAEDHDLEDVWFQQDGATAHTARISLGVLQQMFPGREYIKEVSANNDKNTVTDKERSVNNRNATKSTVICFRCRTTGHTTKNCKSITTS